MPLPFSVEVTFNYTVEMGFSTCRLQRNCCIKVGYPKKRARSNTLAGKKKSD